MSAQKDHDPLFSLFKMGVSIHNLNKKTEKKLGLSLVQWCLLKRLIDLPAASASSLASAVGVHPSTLTQTLRRLGRKGFIYVAEDPKDSRKKAISITRSGRDILHTSTRDMVSWSKDLLVSVQNS
ncbi:MarR family transcriptional regulator [bacterium]|nr:MarR family transcriptional regulator [bacterium]